MKKIKWLSLLVCVVLTVGMFTSCSLLLSGNSSKEKIFSKAGASITLNESFVEKEYASMTAYYESRLTIVSLLKEEFSSLGIADEAQQISLKEYAELLISGNKLEAEIHEGDLTSFEYSKSVNGKDFSYFATVFKASDAYWFIQFGCESKNFEAEKPTFEKYAKSVSFE